MDKRGDASPGASGRFRRSDGRQEAALVRPRNSPRERASETGHLPAAWAPNAGLTACERLLDQYGYEPVRDTPTRLRLRNCPFHPLAAKAPELVCGMNQAFLSGCLRGLEVNGVQAVLAPEPGECCVRLGPSDPEHEEEGAEDHRAE
ncbi:hypothetical protein [Streptomyces sp. NPDC017673]|uniref:hypothetical protein n=1 Tax=unclassified Streptomyces TaxID=2593676 RepID=UPI00379D87F3